MAELQAQQAGVQDSASAMLQLAQQRLSTTTLTEGELAAVKEKTAAAAEMEAAAEAAAKKAELLAAGRQRVEQEVWTTEPVSCSCAQTVPQTQRCVVAAATRAKDNCCTKQDLAAAV